MDSLDYLLSKIDQSQTETGKTIIWVKMSPVDWQRILKVSRSDKRLFISTKIDDLKLGVVGMIVNKGIYLQASRDIPEEQIEFSYHETSN
jgi:hypothetical protein